MSETSLLVMGASVRAAAFSALRAQLQPWCADLFADADLRARCTSVRIAAAQYPAFFNQIAGSAPPGAWIYTGALENYPALIHQLAAQRPLWGNDAGVLHKARDPVFVFEVLHTAGMACPRVFPGTAEPTVGFDWLLKPYAGGAGIRMWDGNSPAKVSSRQYFFQERIAGEPHAAIYVGDGQTAQLLGVTRQLVGESWLHAGPFAYCGSIGPIDLEIRSMQMLQQLGLFLARGCGLRGLFGVDFVLVEGVPWPVEVNPRYTASVEVHEYATGTSMLALHQRAFEDAASAPVSAAIAKQVVGKAILYAKEDLAFPATGRWQSALTRPAPIDHMPDFADIPNPGERISSGRPILTFFARAPTAGACLGLLQREARELDCVLFPP